MKTTRILEIGDTKYETYLTIKDMRMIEREIGQSLLSIFDAASLSVVVNMTKNIDIDLVVAVLRFGIHDDKHGKRSDDELYDLIDTYCNTDDNTMDLLGGHILALIFDTGLYNKVKFHPTGVEKNAEATESKTAANQ